MKISMDILVDCLLQYKITQVFGPPSEPVLEGALLLFNEIEQVEPQYVYIGIKDDLDSLEHMVAGACLIIYGDMPHCPPKASHYSLFHVEGDVDFGLFFNEVVEIFTYYTNWEKRLLALGDAPLQAYIDEGDSITKHPLSIIDYSESTLAVSQGKHSDDIIWREIQKGHIRTKLLRYDSIQASDIAKGTHPVQLYSTVSERYLLVQPILLNGHTVGFVSAHMTKPGDHKFTRGTIHLLTYFTSVITERMRRDETFNLSMGLVHEYFTIDLIEKKYVNEADIADRASFLDWEMVARRRMLRIELSDESSSQMQLMEMRRHLQGILRDCVCILYKKALVIIESNSDDAFTLEQHHPGLQRWLDEHNAHCGASNVFDSLCKTADYYLQAEKALEFGRIDDPANCIYYYHNYMFMHSVQLLDNIVDLESLYHPVLTRMLELYGEDHAMLETLKTYLQCERSITQSAKKLFIHRNSLIYRIEQFNEKLNYDFSDYNTRAQILYSFDILDYIRRIQRKVKPGSETDE